MKIMFVDPFLTGHHIPYMKSLMDATEAEEVLCIPELLPDSDFGRAKVYCAPYLRKGKPCYFRWMQEVRSITHQERPDVVHFLCGDLFYRYAGFGIGSIRAKKVMTFHHVRHWSRPAIEIYKYISRQTDVMVYHTDSLVRRIQQHGITNAVHIEYPQFNEYPEVGQAVAKRALGLPDDGVPVVLALGGTRYLKGLDILLEAMKAVKAPFRLLIAGKSEDFDEAFIHEHSRSYQRSVFSMLEFLSGEEFNLCLNACDIVCLPYRKKFDGASGPLGEGVHWGKLIVGPDHGSLGDIIRRNHLGMTFESEHVEDLTRVLNEALQTAWAPDETYRLYQQSLGPALFQKKYRELYNSLLRNGISAGV